MYGRLLTGSVISHAVEAYRRLTENLADGESHGELVAELLSIYESTRFVQEGYSE